MGASPSTFSISLAVPSMDDDAKRRILLTVTSTDTIYMVKERLATKLLRTPEHQRLFFGGRELEDGRTIKFYKFQDRHCLHLVFRPVASSSWPLLVPSHTISENEMVPSTPVQHASEALEHNSVQAEEGVSPTQAVSSSIQAMCVGDGGTFGSDCSEQGVSVTCPSIAGQERKRTNGRGMTSRASVVSSCSENWLDKLPPDVTDRLLQALLAQDKGWDLLFLNRETRQKVLRSTTALVCRDQPRHCNAICRAMANGACVSFRGWVPRLTFLDLGHNAMGACNTRMLAPVLRQCASLRLLDLSNNGFGDEGAACVAEVLEAAGVQSTLEWLDLSHNKVAAAGILAIASALPQCKRLVWMSLLGNTLDSHATADDTQEERQKVRRGLDAAVKDCASLQHIVLPGHAINSLRKKESLIGRRSGVECTVFASDACGVSPAECAFCSGAFKARLRESRAGDPTP